MERIFMNMRFAGALKKLREEKGLSQRELAEKMYVTRSTVVRWEKGSRLPLTLQPVAENAVKHGLDPDSDALHILIRTRYEDKITKRSIPLI